MHADSHQFSTGRRSAPAVYALAACVLALGMSGAASAGTYFTFSSAPGAIVQLSNYQSTSFLGFYDQFINVPAIGSVNAYSSTGTPLGNYSLGTTSSYYMSPQDPTTHPASAVRGVVGLDYEHYVPNSGDGDFSLSSTTNSTNLLSARIDGVSVYAKPGSNTALIELDLVNATSSLISGVASSLYLDITGTTTAASGPISLSLLDPNSNPPAFTFNTFTLDYSGGVSTTPYSPFAVAVPEASSYALMLAGIGLLALVARARRPNLRAVTPGSMA